MTMDERQTETPALRIAREHQSAPKEHIWKIWARITLTRPRMRRYDDLDFTGSSYA